MGEAKRRGTYEQRKAAAVERDQKILAKCKTEAQKNGVMKLASGRRAILARALDIDGGDA